MIKKYKRTINNSIKYSINQKFDELFSEEFNKKLSSINYRTMWQKISNSVLDRLNTLNYNTTEISILELGCGVGNILSYLENSFGLSVGIELGSKHCGYAKKNTKHSYIMRADFECLPIKHESVDVILARGILGHVRGADKFITDCLKRIKPGGVFIGIQAFHDHPYYFLMKKISDLLGCSNDLAPFVQIKKKGVKKILKKLNLLKQTEFTTISGFYEPFVYSGVKNKKFWQICNKIESKLQKMVYKPFGFYYMYIIEK